MRRPAESLRSDLTELRGEGRDDEARMLETLASLPFLEGVSPQALRRLASDVRQSVFPSGSVVLRAGDADGVGFFVVLSGVAKVRIGDREVREVRRGDHFGAVATIDGGPRTATVHALTELRCLILTDAAFHELVHDQPNTAWRVLVYLAGLVRASGLGDG